jgi:glycerol-3-phosphate O-acyltransferase / dihydroxyacetone phosphate acyltransferase
MATQASAGRSVTVEPLPPDRPDRFYAFVQAVARFWVWFFFRRVDVQHAERVPSRGPALLAINHPNNLIDSLLVGAVLPRKVHYLATAALFRNSLLARFLLTAGAIPVYRRQDDPERTDRNVEAFAACFSAFDEGQVVGIYPEGTTHAEARVQRIKTGAARIALAYEAAHPGRLTLVPVGLSFEARKSFKGRVLVSFGEPVPIAPYARAGAQAVDGLTTAIQWAMEREVVHVDRVDATALVRAVEQLYRGALERELTEERGLTRDRIDPFRLSRSIVDAVNHFKEREPERVERLWHRIQGYRALLEGYRLRDETLRSFAEPRTARRRLFTSWLAVLGLPLFAYGALVNALPYIVPRRLAHRMARKETDYATVRLLASIVAFPVFWSLQIWVVWRLAGLAWALVFAASLPVSGLIAYRYLVGTGRLRQHFRLAALRWTCAQEARRLLVERREIIAELERAKADYLTATRGSSF